MTASTFEQCLTALDNITSAFRLARSEVTSAPSQYEADFAAFKLMQQVWLHVNAVSAIAAIPYTGSHLASAWVLLRAVFETGLTALWLAADDDWKEREARWLGWITSHEEHLNKVAGDIHKLNAQASQEFVQYANLLRQRRESISRVLPKDSRLRRPSLLEMMRQVNVNQGYYVAYRIGSQVTHGGAGMDDMVVRSDGDAISFYGAVGPSSWKEPFRMAGWSITQPGIIVLARAGASAEACNKICDAHHILIDLTETLNDAETHG